MSETPTEIEQLRRQAKAAREWAKGAHPFDRSQPLDPEQDIYDDGAESDAVLVAMPGTADKMLIPAVEFFETIDDWQLRRIYIRRLSPMLELPHQLGTSVPEIAESLRELVKGYQRVVFMGTSLGGFHALLFATFVQPDAVVLINPVTSVLRHVLDKAGDTR
jgi:hypothetical protein